jgi:hypothetical protein
MPSPKSGTAGSAVAPTDPVEAQEADQADPGEVEKAKAEQIRTQTGKYGSAKSKGRKPGDESSEENKDQKRSWIEIELVDKKNKPVPGEPYRVTLPDGEKVVTGTLDEKGFARVEDIDPGTCKVTFPRLEKQAWKPK